MPNSHTVYNKATLIGINYGFTFDLFELLTMLVVFHHIALYNREMVLNLSRFNYTLYGRSHPKMNSTFFEDLVWISSGI